MSLKSYFIGSSGLKKLNSSALKQILKKSIDVELSIVVRVDGGVRLNLKNVGAKLAATLNDFYYFCFFLRYCLDSEEYQIEDRWKFVIEWIVSNI